MTWQEVQWMFLILLVVLVEVVPLLIDLAREETKEAAQGCSLARKKLQRSFSDKERRLRMTRI